MRKRATAGVTEIPRAPRLARNSSVAPLNQELGCFQTSIFQSRLLQTLRFVGSQFHYQRTGTITEIEPTIVNSVKPNKLALVGSFSDLPTPRPSTTGFLSLSCKC